MTNRDFLKAILARKRREIERRRNHYKKLSSSVSRSDFAQAKYQSLYSALSRENRNRPKVIAEIKLKSPSAGIIRECSAGAVSEIARAYEAAGAAAVSVLCDRLGFGGSLLDVRRAASAVTIPILFKEFVLDEIQVCLAGVAQAQMVLLMVCALSASELKRLVIATHHQGLVPLIEVAKKNELEIALDTETAIIGVNARDLRTFRVDARAATKLIDCIPKERVAIYMSGVGSKEELKRIADTRADAVLIGEALMKAPSPGDKLREILG
ncbi:MAG: indole-3-glycerol-phosphate synthase [Deltaproteobacteria bacterium]|nr:indole-3-glycerol-phosphate synthase [Deltaproteobacteria bacterium]